jgi:hypothetical protein
MDDRRDTKSEIHMQTENTTPISNRVIRDPNLTVQDKSVFAALAYMANTSPGSLPFRCQTTTEDIAKVLGTQEKGLRGSMTRLQANGYIRWAAGMLSPELIKPGKQIWEYKIELIWD